MLPLRGVDVQGTPQATDDSQTEYAETAYCYCILTDYLTDMIVCDT